jgi:tetratricopeptide (TPR) repeat protein
MAETEFKYDVFVSYSSANKEWVRKTFVPILEKAGLNVCDYYRDFDVGAPIVMEMERAILESRKTVPVLSPAYLKSGWTEFESLMFQTLDAANRNRRVLPVIFETCELPLRIKYMNCINFANPDDVGIEWERLSRALEITLSPSLINTPKSTTGSRDTWHLAHPYPMPPNFTGRAAELQMLDDWLADNTNRLFLLRALGGFGKSALSWQWINTHVNPAEWTKLVWWSFYEGDASFEHFVEETLKYLKLEVPQGKREQVNELLNGMQSQKVLLIMDGFERALRAYSSMNAAYQGDEEPKLEDNQLDCVSVDAEYFLKSVCSLPNRKSKVLMTTRLSPRAVKPHGEFMLGCREEGLTAMQKADAVTFFQRQKIKGTHAEIEAACAPYGYHPLSLRLLAGRILKDFENPADIVVAQKLKMDGDIIQQKHHVLEVSYNSLPPYEGKLLSTIACFRSPVEHKTLESIAENKDTLDKDLHDLVERGLLHFDEKNKKFDLHPIVRRFAYDRFTASQRTNAHVILVAYFEAVPQPQKIETLDDLAPVIELYHHMVKAGKLDEACDLIYDRFANALLYQFGAYQLYAELLRALFLDGEDKLPRLRKESAKRWTLNALGAAYAMSGQPYRSVKLRELQNIICEREGDKKNLAIGLGNMGSQQLVIGALSAAERNLRRQIDLYREIADEGNEPDGHRELGRLLSYKGSWDLSTQELELSWNQSDKQHHIQRQSTIAAYQSLRSLLLARDNPKSSIENLKSAIESAQRALELADKWQKITGRSNPNPRDYTRALWLLGAAYCMNNELTLAEETLSKALNLCRQINMVDHEANILLDLARLRFAQGDFKDAQEKASEALVITERSGYVLQGADVNLFLAQYALEQEQDKVKAKEYAKTALKLATCDGPPYYYKVAYEEAERLIVQLEE